mmetsp:Transcript_10114/g.29819  ORF Transcript_10114/g.29819 Transcript_10114/m.29819 type:complete len:200 (+) Transcript_10114:1832-2431(+)
MRRVSQLWQRTACASPSSARSRLHARTSMISWRVVMTKGPCWTTGSPMGFPWRRRISTSSAPEASSGQLASPWSWMPVLPVNFLPSAVSSAPLKKKILRFVSPPPRAGGRVHLAPFSSLMVTIATSVSSTRWAYDSGGGEGTPASTSAGRNPRPATTAMVTDAEPGPSVGMVRLGMSSLQSILKWGSAILLARGRFIQI